MKVAMFMKPVQHFLSHFMSAHISTDDGMVPVDIYVSVYICMLIFPVYWWRYNIRLENLSQEQVQLRERHWKIYSLTGRLETVKGKGVIGQEPVLSVSQPAFQYSSHVSLRCPSGHMW